MTNTAYICIKSLKIISLRSEDLPLTNIHSTPVSPPPIHVGNKATIPTKVHYRGDISVTGTQTP